MHETIRPGPGCPFRAYVLQTRGSLLWTATQLASGNAHMAEELVQTVLLRMYVSWPRIRVDTRDAYARKMLVNAHIDEPRRPHARHEQKSRRCPGRRGRIGPALGRPGCGVRRAGRAAAADGAAVILRHLHDLSVAETAAALGCGEGTVKSQTARGLAQLRATLAELSNETGDDGMERSRR